MVGDRLFTSIQLLKMPKERCWKCKKIKTGVELRACDDRLCENCYQDNERKRNALIYVSSALPSDNRESTATETAVKSSDMVMDFATDTGDAFCMSSDYECCVPNCKLVKCEKMLKCAVCSKTCHGQCAGYDNHTTQTLLMIINEVGWVCLTCQGAARNIVVKLQSSYEDLSKRTSNLEYVIETLGSEFRQLKELIENPVELNSVQSVKLDIEELKTQILILNEKQNSLVQPIVRPSKDADAAVRTVVNSELADKQRRRTNVVVTGLVPRADTDDADTFLEICESHLTIRPVVIRQRCRRLGKPIVGKVQPLLIVLDREEAVQELLHSASKLRHADDDIIRNHVYINADLTPAERQAAYEQRQRIRERHVNTNVNAISI
jgi:hypothetical protein